MHPLAPTPTLSPTPSPLRGVALRVEGWTGWRLRPRCAGCAAPHPQADEPPEVPMRPGTTCPECGTLATEPGPYVHERAIAPDPAVRAGGVLMRLGAFFHRLADRI